ncbi:MAG: hypothetical protein KME06_21260 [Kastovskya adunca ATA6-11-RM4]|jgi:hypothetical protein|nr:hypothetical protein [Kastovskya adunca ATA6-11-RM4]
MDIHLSDADIAQMPEPGRTLFLNWLPEYLEIKKFHPVAVPQQSEKPEVSFVQLDLSVEPQNPQQETEHTHVRLTQLFEAGITQQGMVVRVKLKRNLAKRFGRQYREGLEISPKGTIVFNGQEFDKPSPLAAKVNGSSANGWEYVKVKKNDQWVCLDELRQIWRKTND